MSQIQIEINSFASGVVHIDRFYVPTELRGTGIGTNAMIDITSRADANSVVLTASIMPDEPTDSEYDTTRKFFLKHGFEPDEFDGEVYVNDLVRKPKKT